MRISVKGLFLFGLLASTACAGNGNGSPDVTDLGDTDVAEIGVPADSSEDAPGIDPDAAFENAKVALTTWMDTYHVPGASVAVLLDGKIAYSAAFGVKEAGGDAKVGVDTLFQGGSIGKIVTALGIFSAVRDGLVDLDAPLTDALPYFALADGSDASTVTLHNLLCHTSGLGEWNAYGFKMDAQTCAAEGTTLSDYWHQTTDAEQWVPAGSLFVYSTPGYSLAGLALAEATGSSYADAVTSRVLEPSGMTSAVVGLDRAAAAPDHATGHLVADGNATPIPVSPPECKLWEPAGGVWGSALDWGHLLELLLAKGAPVLTPDLYERLVTPATQATFSPAQWYAQGLLTSTHDGRTLVYNGGLYSGGFSGFYLLVPDARFGVVVLTNGLGDIEASLMGVVGAVTDAFLSFDVTPEFVVKTVPAEWSVYEGIYHEPNVFKTAEVSVVDDHLRVVLKDYGNMEIRLDQYTGDTWRGSFAGQQVVVTFWRTAPGQEASHIVSQAGVFERVPD